MASLQLLLVDDEAEFLEPTAARLARRGVACTSAQTGQAALDALAARKFDCVVADLRMPGIDGLQLLVRMRHEYPNLPVILLTGHGSVELGVRGMDLGAFDYLLKPVDLDELLDAVRRAAAGMTTP
jgi:two-component system, OmpR family, response regulator